MRNPRSR